MTSLEGRIYALYEGEGPTSVRGHLPTASSGLASICPRYAWYEYHSPIPRVIGPWLRRRLNYGNIHEDVLLRELRESRGIRIKGTGYRVTLWGVKGRIDTLVSIEEGPWMLLEIKTMNPEDFKKFQKEGLAAFLRYYEQFNFYLAALERLPFSERIDRGILLAENTWPLGELHSQQLGIDRLLVEEMEANKETLDLVLSQGEPPPRPFLYDSKECSHCFRKSECWEVKQPPRAVSATELPDGKELIEWVIGYLKADSARKAETDRIDQAKAEIRTILDRNNLTEVRIPIAQDLSYTVTLSQVSVGESVTKPYTYPRLDIR